jgi:hypothetical protein
MRDLGRAVVTFWPGSVCIHRESSSSTTCGAGDGSAVWLPRPGNSGFMHLLALAAPQTGGCWRGCTHRESSSSTTPGTAEGCSAGLLCGGISLRWQLVLVAAVHSGGCGSSCGSGWKYTTRGAGTSEGCPGSMGALACTLKIHEAGGLPTAAASCRHLPQAQLLSSLWPHS